MGREALEGDNEPSETASDWPPRGARHVPLPALSHSSALVDLPASRRGSLVLLFLDEKG
jgi:hypothetical protein